MRCLYISYSEIGLCQLRILNVVEIYLLNKNRLKFDCHTPLCIHNLENVFLNIETRLDQWFLYKNIVEIQVVMVQLKNENYF